MKKLVISCVSGLLFICQLAYGQTNSYKPVGHVNDFANLLDIQSKNNLESKLRDYKNKTSIEVVVVIVPSLDGLTVEAYTLNLAQRWGVGDKQKDNGVVLLVAPNERKVRIEVGYGMEPDLTDAQAGRIIRNVIIPHFRNQQMQEGILAGTNAVLGTLGSTPFEARIEERKAAEEKSLADKKRRNEETAAFMTVAGVVLLVLLVLGMGVFVIYKFFKNREELRKQYRQNAANLVKCHDLFDEARKPKPKRRSSDDSYNSNYNSSSSWSSSSSSSSSGSSFDGFGGGSFGGGGASGSW